MIDLAMAIPGLRLLPSPWSTLNATDPCGWTGVACANDSVISIVLENTQLEGTLPDSIGQLVNMETINFYNNSINSTIPASIGSMTQLRYLYLSRNPLFGTIPPSIFALLNLKSLELENNDLTGSLPDFPEGSRLEFVFISYTSLSGTIPASIANLSMIDTFQVEACSINGTLPTVGPTGWRDLSLSYMDISGPIPDWIYRSTNITRLKLISTKLNGTVSSAVANLTDLGLLHLGGSEFAPPIPVELASMTSLRYLSIAYSSMGQGTSISFFSQMDWIEELDLDASGISGTIPDLSNMTSLGALSLSYNNIVGTVPESLVRLHLSELMMIGCNLNGTIPASIGSASMNVLRLAGNQLSGCFLEPTTVTECDITGNPTSFCSCRSRSCLPACSDCSKCPDPLFCPPGTTCITGGLAVGGQNSTLVVFGPTIIRGNLTVDPNATIIITASSPSAPLVVQGCVSFAGALNISVSGNQPLSTTVSLIQYSGFCGGQKTEFQNVSIDLGACRRGRGTMQYGETSLIVLLSDIDESQCSQAGVLSPGAIGGIVAGVVAVLIIVLCIIIYTQRRKIIPAFTMMSAQRRLRESMRISSTDK
jgi:hypothetical protein